MYPRVSLRPVHSFRRVTCPPAAPKNLLHRRLREQRNSVSQTMNNKSSEWQKKQLGSKSNFSPFCLVLEGEGRPRSGNVAAFFFLLVKPNQRSNKQTPLSCSEQTIYESLWILTWRAVCRCEFLHLTQGGTWSSSRPNLCNWSEHHFTTLLQENTPVCVCISCLLKRD